MMFNKPVSKRINGNQLAFLTLMVCGMNLTSCGEGRNKPDPEKPANRQKVLKKKASEPVAKEETFDILRLLLLEESKDAKKKEIDFKNHSVSFPNDGDAYTVSFRVMAQEDFNKDGVTDYLIDRTSEGMLGGNANSNSQVSYLIMGPDHQIVQEHQVLTYAPFSYNILDEIGYKKGKLKARATQNFRTYMPENAEDLQSTSLSFVYKDGNLYEESYLNECALAKWKNKQLFSGSEVTRTIEMHNYTELVREKYTSGKFEVSAEYSGCDNLNLTLETIIPFRSKDKKAIADKRMSFLDFLKKNTALFEELELIRNYYLENEYTDKQVELEQLSFRLFTSQEKGKMRLFLVIDQNKNPNQSENWEITTRSK